jgi:hypothetical protein
MMPAAFLLLQLPNLFNKPSNHKGDAKVTAYEIIATLFLTWKSIPGCRKQLKWPLPVLLEDISGPARQVSLPRYPCIAAGHSAASKSNSMYVENPSCRT